MGLSWLRPYTVRDPGAAWSFSRILSDAHLGNPARFHPGFATPLPAGQVFSAGLPAFPDESNPEKMGHSHDFFVGSSALGISYICAGNSTISIEISDT